MRQARVSLPYYEAVNKEEMKYWLAIMKDHTVFIKAGLPAECVEFREDAKEFAKAFSSLQSKLDKLKNQKQCEGFHQEICQVMEAFYQYKRNLLSLRITGKLGGSNFPSFLEHLAREANYFLQLLNLPNKENMLQMSSQTQEVVTWLRFMADHTRLIGQYIDPAERQMQQAAREFAELFDSLCLEGRDFAAMLYCHKGEMKAFSRFLQDVRSDVQRFCDFNKMAKELIDECRLLTIMTPQLADHLRREAKHCFVVITMLEKGLSKHCAPVFEDDIDEFAWKLPERIDEEDKCDEPLHQEQEDILYYAGNTAYDPYDELDGEDVYHEYIEAEPEIPKPNIAEKIQEAVEDVLPDHEVEEIPEAVETVKIEPTMERSNIEVEEKIEEIKEVQPKKEAVKEAKKVQKKEKIQDILPVSTPAKAFARDVKEAVLQKAAENKSMPVQSMPAGPAANIEGISRTMKTPAMRIPRALGKRN